MIATAKATARITTKMLQLIRTKLIELEKASLFLPIF